MDRKGELPQAALARPKASVGQEWVLTGRATVGFALAFVLFVCAGVSGFREQSHIGEAGVWSMHTVDVIEASRVIGRLITDAETGERGYLLTGNDRYLAPYDAARSMLPSRVAHLRQLVDAESQERVDALGVLIEKKLTDLGAAVELRRRGDVEGARATLDVDPGGGTTEQIRVILREFQDRERALLDGRIAAGLSRGRRVRLLVAIATFLGAALALASVYGLNAESRRRLVAEREVARVEVANEEAARTLEERNKTLVALRVAREEAERASRAKDEFLALLSHELRSPLNAMLGWLTLLRRGALSREKTEHALETIERNIHLQTQLVNDLLDVSRITSGKLSLDHELVDLSAIVHLGVENARLVAEAKGVSLVSHLTPHSGTVLGDEKRLQQVVGNILTNAIKFTPAGGSVNVELEADDREAAIAVRDTGVGIPKDFLPHVFDRFRQADGSTTRRHGGLGLGLSIVRTLTELHGGRVEAESEGDGRGASFTVRLPLTGLRADRTSTTNAEEKGGLRGIHVVVVEDDEDARDALRIALEENGARVEACSSAKEAFSLIDRAAPDLIVSDIGMPEEDGYQLMRRVRALSTPRVPAIAVTGFASRQDQEDAARAGFDAHIPKPVPPDVLVAKARDLVQRRGAS